MALKFWDPAMDVDLRALQTRPTRENFCESSAEFVTNPKAPRLDR